MIQFAPTTTDDFDQISSAINADPWHQGQNPEFWLTGAAGSLLSFTLLDDAGTVFFVRCDEPQNGVVRLHVQFRPEREVPKGRLVRAMLRTMPVLFRHLATKADALIFESTSPDLIKFFQRHGFWNIPTTNDFVLLFEDENGKAA